MKKFILYFLLIFSCFNVFSKWGENFPLFRRIKHNSFNSQLVITGASGSVGSRILDYFLREGYSVRGIVRPDTENSWRLPASEEEGLELEEGDLFSLSTLESLIQPGSPIFHFGAIAKGFFKPEEYAPTIALNGLIPGVIAYLREEKGLSESSRFIYASSQMVHRLGPESDVPIKESDPIILPEEVREWRDYAVERFRDSLPQLLAEAKSRDGDLRPLLLEFVESLMQERAFPEDVTPYQMGKLIAESLLSQYPNLVIIRMTNAYGEGDFSIHRIPTMMRDFKEGRLTFIPAKREDYIHFDDIGAILEKIIKLPQIRKGENDVIHLASGEVVTPEYFQEMIEKYLPEFARKVVWKKVPREAQILDNTRARRLLGREFISFEEGFRRHIEWLREFLNLPAPEPIAVQSNVRQMQTYKQRLEEIILNLQEPKVMQGVKMKLEGDSFVRRLQGYFQPALDRLDELITDQLLQIQPRSQESKFIYGEIIQTLRKLEEVIDTFASRSESLILLPGDPYNGEESAQGVTLRSLLKEMVDEEYYREHEEELVSALKDYLAPIRTQIKEQSRILRRIARKLSGLSDISMQRRALWGALAPGKKLGILCSSFNPPTINHLRLAEQAKEEFGLDEVIFISTFHKQTPGSTLQDRIDMAVAIADERGEETFSVATSTMPDFDELAEELKEFYPAGIQMYFLMGSDTAVKAFEGAYRNPARLAQLFADGRQLLIVNRGGERENSAYLRSLPAYQKYASQIHFLNNDQPYEPISSSLVRRLIAEGQPFAELVPPEVYRIIVERGLYGYGEGN